MLAWDLLLARAGDDRSPQQIEAPHRLFLDRDPHGDRRDLPDIEYHRRHRSPGIIQPGCAQLIRTILQLLAQTELRRSRLLWPHLSQRAVPVGKQQHHVNYRHVITSLLRKPGGFRDYRYREALFPSLLFKQAWEQLNHAYAPRKADLIYLRILHLAALHLKVDVATALACLMETTAP